MKSFVIFFICLLFSSTGFADICDRTLEVRFAIVLQLKKHCNAVGEADLSNITKLEFSLPAEVVIDNLKSGDFSGLVNLKTLEITNGGLSELPADIFSGLSNLEYLNLQDNRLQTIPPRIFKDLKMLKALYLGINQIASIPEEMADDLGSVETLELESQNELPRGFLQKLRQLKEFRIYGGTFDDLDLSGLYNLEVLQLARGSFSPKMHIAIPSGSFKDLSNLKVLDLDHISLEPGFLENLSKLEKLEIYQNFIPSLAKKEFLGVAKTLKSLSLNTEGIQTIEESPLEYLSELKELYVNLAVKDKVPFDYFFNGLNKLEKLHLKLSDDTVSLPGNTLLGLPSLKWLRIDSKMTSLPVGIFRELDQVEDMIFAWLQLTELNAELFVNLRSLKDIRFLQGKLETLPENLFQNLPQLKVIKLNQNKITTLPKDIFLSLKGQIELITLYLNPLDQETKTNLKANFAERVEF